MGYEGLIGVVGNCVAGKTTLVNGLKSKGYRAVNIAQEHSTAQRLWQRKKPDYLVCISCSLESAQKRREIYWGQERLDDQWQRLTHARERCDLFLATDGMEIEDVLTFVIAAVNNKNTN